jgi:hypothetical protein
MVEFDELPDIEREVLRVLFRALPQPLTVPELASRIYYPDDEVADALDDMLYRGLVVELPVGYVPSEEMIPQMKAKKDAAAAALRAGLDDLKKLMQEFGLRRR